MHTRTVAIGVILLSFVLFGGSARAAPARAAKKSAKVDKSQVVLAEVNGHKITLADVEERLRSMPPAVRIQVKKNKKQFLEGLVQAELLYQEAVRRNLDQQPAVKKRLGRLRRRILVQEFVRQDIDKEEAIPEKDLRDFYEANKERFRRKEAVTLSHIVLKTEQEAWDALAEVRRGVPFAQVARERSIFETTRDAGGVMGTAERGTLDKKLEEVAFKLAIGQVSDPVETPIGWQIVRVTEKTAAAEARFEDVKADVRVIFTELKRRERYRKLLDGLVSSGKIAIHPERFP